MLVWLLLICLFSLTFSIMLLTGHYFAIRLQYHFRLRKNLKMMDARVQNIMQPDVKPQEKERKAQLSKKNKKKIMQQLPDVLYMMSNSLKAGYSIIQVFDQISKENLEPLSSEFAKLVQQIQFGDNYDHALQNFANRIDIDALYLVTDAILITKETGGNLTKIIDSLLDIMRNNQSLQREARTLTTQGRASAWVVGSLPLALFLLLLMISPQYMSSLFHNPVGNLLILVAIILQAIGIFIIYRIVQLKIR